MKHVLVLTLFCGCLACSAGPSFNPGDPATDEFFITSLLACLLQDARCPGPPLAFVAVGAGGVTFGNGRFVTVSSNGKAFSSPDGITWTGPISITANALYAITYGNDRFVTVGNASETYSSTDGSSWSGSTTGGSFPLYCVAYGNARFVLGGTSGGGVAFWSADAASWTAGTPGPGTGISWPKGVASGKDRFVTANSNGATYWSSNGSSWSGPNTAAPGSLNAIASGLVAHH